MGWARNGTGMKWVGSNWDWPWNTRARNGMGPKWDGPEMGHSEPKWETRNGNGMGLKWDGPEMARPKMAGLDSTCTFISSFTVWCKPSAKPRQREREVQFLHWINNQLRVAKAASVVPKGRSPSVRMWPSRLKPTELKKKAVSGLRTIVLNTSTSCVTHYGYCKFKNIYKRSNLK